MKAILPSLLGLCLFFNAYGQRNVQRYDYSIAGNQVVVSDFIEFDGLSEEQIWVNASLYFINQGDEGMGGIESMNFKSKKMVVRQQVVSDEFASVETSYQYETTFQLSDNLLSFNSTDIKVNHRVIMKEFRNIPFEKLDPDKKSKHKAYLNEFIEGNSRCLAELFNFIRTNEYQPITHWKGIESGQLEEGMNETECLLAYGKPRHVRESSNNLVRWMYDNDFVVFFKDGVITSIVN